METKVCSECGKELSIDNFNKRKDTKNGLRANCRECQSQYNKQWTLDNKEHKAEYHEKWYKDNKAAVTKKNKQWRQGPAWRRNKAVAAESNKKYRQEHLEERRVCTHRRKARQRLLPSTLTIQQWESIKEHFNNLCAYCGENKKLTIEHFVPVSKMGELTVNNVLPVCSPCNNSKGARNFLEWYPEYRRYSQKREKAIIEYLNYKNGSQQLIISL